MDVEHPNGGHRRLCRHREGDQSADRGAGGDAVAMLDGHAMRHKTAHREAGEEDAVHVEGVLLAECVEQRHQEARVVGVAVHQTRIPHGAVAFVARLRHHDGPAELIRDLREMVFIIDARDVVAQAMQEE